MGDTGPDIRSVPGILPSQARALRATLDALTTAVSSIPSDVLGFPEFTEQAPGLSNLETLSLAGLENVASGLREGGGRQQSLQRGRETLEQLATADFDEEAFDEFFRGAVQEPLLEDFTQEVLPAISRRTAASGFFGSARRGAEGRATEDLADALSGERARLAFGTRETGLQRALEAAQLLPAAVQAEPRILTTLLAAGAVPRSVELSQFQTRRQEFLRQLDEAARRLGLSGQLSTARTQETVGIPGDEGLLPGIVEGLFNLGSGAIAASGARSSAEQTAEIIAAVLGQIEKNRLDTRFPRTPGTGSGRFF